MYGQNYRHKQINNSSERKNTLKCYLIVKKAAPFLLKYYLIVKKNKEYISYPYKDVFIYKIN